MEEMEGGPREFDTELSSSSNANIVLINASRYDIHITEINLAEWATRELDIVSETVDNMTQEIFLTKMDNFFVPRIALGQGINTSTE